MAPAGKLKFAKMAHGRKLKVAEMEPFWGIGGRGCGRREDPRGWRPWKDAHREDGAMGGEPSREDRARCEGRVCEDGGRGACRNRAREDGAHAETHLRECCARQVDRFLGWRPVEIYNPEINPPTSAPGGREFGIELAKTAPDKKLQFAKIQADKNTRSRICSFGNVAAYLTVAQYRRVNAGS